MPEALLPSLPCPECRERGLGGGTRIGNQRRTCGTCNRWAQRIMRQTRNRLKNEHLKEYEKLRLEVERDFYPQVLEEYRAGQSAPRPTPE